MFFGIITQIPDKALNALFPTKDNESDEDSAACTWLSGANLARCDRDLTHRATMSARLLLHYFTPDVPMQGESHSHHCIVESGQAELLKVRPLDVVIPRLEMYWKKAYKIETKVLTAQLVTALLRAENCWKVPT